MKEIVIIRASPHANGVTDLLCSYLLKGLTDKGGEANLISLREENFLPCSGCNYCASPPHNCILDQGEDRAKAILKDIQAAKIVVFFAPIFFYALPAKAKALVDRAQCFWQKNKSAQQKSDPRLNLGILAAGRSRGQNLFLGAELTLRYFFLALGRKNLEFRKFRGLDDLNDHKPAVQEELSKLGSSLYDKLKSI
ncbi:MAG: flavodoxin family protein [Desulfovibrio sp.]|nr:flavodoxin family protein [Desulfovibrio sp.]